MKQTVVIHVDALRREYVSDWLLAKKLESIGFRVILTSRVSTDYLLKIFKPNILILSHVFALPVPVLKVLNESGVKVFVNEVEGVLGNDYVISTTYPTGIDYSVFSGIFVWNDWANNWLINNREISRKKVCTVGSIRNGFFTKEKKKRDTHVVGVISRFEVINPFDGRHNFENLLIIDSEDEKNNWYYDRVSIDSEALSIISKLIGILVNNDITVLIRPHPNENISTYRFLKERFGERLQVDESYDITGWLDKVDVVVGPTSSGYTEPYLSNIPVISIDSIQNKKYRKGYVQSTLEIFAKAAHMPRTVSEAADMCMKLSLDCKRDVELDDYFDKFYSLKSTPNPIDEVADVIRREKDKSTSLSGVFGCFIVALKVIVDIVVIIRFSLTLKPFDSLRNLNQYNYNVFLHKPDSYMKRLVSKNRNKLQ